MLGLHEVSTIGNTLMHFKNEDLLTKAPEMQRVDQVIE